MQPEHRHQKGQRDWGQQRGPARSHHCQDRDRLVSRTCSRLLGRLGQQVQQTGQVDCRNQAKSSSDSSHAASARIQTVSQVKIFFFFSQKF